MNLGGKTSRGKTAGTEGALDVEGTGTVWDQRRIIDLVAQFVVEVFVAGCGACRIDAIPVDDVNHAVGLAK